MDEHPHSWKRDAALLARKPRPDTKRAAPHGTGPGIGESKTELLNTMIYIERRMNPVFRILGASRDHMKVILFDQRKQSYATQWVPTHRLAADENSDLHALQEDPGKYTPNLGELVQWRTEHPMATAFQAGRSPHRESKRVV